MPRVRGGKKRGFRVVAEKDLCYTDFSSDITQKTVHNRPKGILPKKHYVRISCNNLLMSQDHQILPSWKITSVKDLKHYNFYSSGCTNENTSSSNPILLKYFSTEQRQKMHFHTSMLSRYKLTTENLNPEISCFGTLKMRKAFSESFRILNISG